MSRANAFFLPADRSTFGLIGYTSLSLFLALPTSLIIIIIMLTLPSWMEIIQAYYYFDIKLILIIQILS